MTIELASTRLVEKPWGSRDLKPFSGAAEGDAPIGEVWFERADPAAPRPRLLLKLLFTTAPLSIQVHPDDAYARSIGLPNGKTEAWSVLAAKPGAVIAVGLKQAVPTASLRRAIEDGSIGDLVQWRPVAAGEAVFVPAGTIHAIGAGLVVAEIQQNSDATFRLYDYGSRRPLQIDEALAVAVRAPAAPTAAPVRLSAARSRLVTSPFFTVERITLPAGSAWTLGGGRETWLLVLDGEIGAGSIVAIAGESLMSDGAQTAVKAGAAGLTALVAHEGGPLAHLLVPIGDAASENAVAMEPGSPHQPTFEAVSPARSPEARP